MAGGRNGECVVETLRDDVEITVISGILQNLNEVVAYGNKLIHVEVSRRIRSHLCGRRRRWFFFRSKLEEETKLELMKVNKVSKLGFFFFFFSFESEGNTFF